MRTVLLLSLITSSVACDTDSSCADPAPVAGLEFHAPSELAPLELEFREAGDPHAVYITSLDGKPIHRKSFTALVAACKQADPPLTVTLSDYAPDVALDQRVIGLGFSALGPSDLLGCYADLFAKNGGISF